MGSGFEVGGSELEPLSLGRGAGVRGFWVQAVRAEGSPSPPTPCSGNCSAIACPRKPNREKGLLTPPKTKKGVVPFDGQPRLSLVFRIRLPRHCACTRELIRETRGFFPVASEAYLPSPFRLRTFALAGARFRFAVPSYGCSRGAAHIPRTWPPPLLVSPALRRSRVAPLRSLRVSTKPSWRPLRDILVLAAVFRIAPRSRHRAHLSGV